MKDAEDVDNEFYTDSTNNSLKWLLGSGSIEQNATSKVKRLWRPSQWWNVVKLDSMYSMQIHFYMVNLPTIQTGARGSTRIINWVHVECLK